MQGFGSFPLNFKALIDHARATGDDSIEWSIVCTTGHYVKKFEELLGKEAVLYLHSDIKNYLDAPDLLDRLSDYCGNIYRNIESEKRFTKHKRSMRQLKRAAAMYLSMKTFMKRRSPTHILFGQIEGLDGMTLISLGRELGIPALVPTPTRHMGETFFSPDHLETLPVDRPVTGVHEAKAADFLRRFRSGETRAAEPPSEIAHGPEEEYSFVQLPFFHRTIGTLRRQINEPEMREWEVFRVSLFLSFPALANLFWKTRGAINKRIYDISILDDLPKSFAYYPLQYSPESSINTPAPYFIDQLRAIDAIRFALPSGMMLVVKEHPACIEQRPLSLLNALQKRAGVVLARYNMSSEQIINRDDITFSVTGTATLEAFLKGKPSLTLGHAFFSVFLGGATGVDSLQQRIREALDHSPSDEEILGAIARVYAISSPFIMGCPFDKDHPFARYAFRKSNIENFYKHLRRQIDENNPGVS